MRVAPERRIPLEPAAIERAPEIVALLAKGRTIEFLIAGFPQGLDGPEQVIRRGGVAVGNGRVANDHRSGRFRPENGPVTSTRGLVRVRQWPDRRFLRK